MILRAATALTFAAMAFGLTGCGAPPSSKTVDAPHNFIVFFHFDSADLTPEARRIVDQAATASKALKPSTIAVAGFTDKVGSPAYNLHLSERRIAVVEQALEGAGIDAKLFLRIPLGNSEAEVGGTGDRRIEIRLQTATNSK